MGCIYLKDLEKVDLEVLEQIVAASYAKLGDGPWTDCSPPCNGFDHGLGGGAPKVEAPVPQKV